MKEKDITQYSVLAAGAFSNVLLAIFAILLLTFVSAPIQNGMADHTGFTFDQYVNKGLPFQQSQILPGTIITGINGESTKNLAEFLNIFQFSRPNEKIIVETEKGNVEVTLAEHPDNNKKPYMGIQGFTNHVVPKKKFQSGIGKVGFVILEWFNGITNNNRGFLFWLFLLSSGIGLFNLLPLPIVDGGRMMQVFLQKLKGEEKGNKMYSFVGMFFLFVLVANLILPWLMGLF